ncbi:hypothetical protein GZH47_33610 (plasmid) [Paenibacillus rhizovicinus]|uniref:Uncharacterized protein n=1 Tax=Paenibacillus rhizovicinus TaxID=2704463 RepID=A0A6C0PBP8_9BACL|nr:hypothetical protein [Paenibacillus rhizovicinus]QHW35831.1 hypothetical protein GZH47_33610 [Paenibacillus rhizovicinus]
MEMIANYIDLVAKNAIDKHGFTRATITISGFDMELEMWVREHSDDRNKGEASVAAGFTNVEHEDEFVRRCLNQKTPFELFFRKGGFIYRFESCVLKRLMPLQLRINMDNGPLPFSLRKFSFKKIVFNYNTQDGRTGLSMRPWR